MRRLTLLLVVFLSQQTLLVRAQEVTLPLKSGSVRFAAIGDMGTGGRPQYEVAERMALYHKMFPFTFVITLGDNIYGGKSPAELATKFEIPYKPLLDAGVQFYASLGNHDDTNERFYKFFNMNGEKYYTFKKGDVHFFALDTDYLDPKQLVWLEKELANAGATAWKICYFHHPLYSSGATHGSSPELRAALEPLFLKYGVQVVLAGHDHLYERVKPQKGITHFVEGASGQLRRGDLRKTDLTAVGYDRDLSFLAVEISGDDLYFQAVSRTGSTVDSGTIRRASPVRPASSR
jgi:3',5'-cyclic AMP phosphodiesterase CpdA